jgi:hypothetical protein
VLTAVPWLLGSALGVVPVVLPDAVPGGDDLFRVDAGLGERLAEL